MMTSFKILRWTPMFALVVACVDPIFIEVPPVASLTIVDGSITDQPGPYEIRITHAFGLDSDSTSNTPVEKVKVVLYSDKDQSEPLVEVFPGVYRTGGQIRGTVGNTYHITLEMPDGATFESVPERLNPAGKIRAINYVFEHRTATFTYGVFDADVFDIYIDADAEVFEDDLTYMRWRFTGTFKVETNPELHTITSQGFTYKDPYPCSGWVVDPALGGGVLRQDTVCTCCECWAQQFETIPRLSDSELVSEGQFRNVKVGEVPITRMTFIDKYYISIEQMSISRNAFDFLKIIRAQKANATNLFQPPPGTNVGNIRAVNADYEVMGLFWATSITQDAIFISREALPYKLPKDVIPFPCTSYSHSSTAKPDFWDE